MGPGNAAFPSQGGEHPSRWRWGGFPLPASHQRRSMVAPGAMPAYVRHREQP